MQGALGEPTEPPCVGVEPDLVRARVKGTRGLTESERRRHKILVDEEPRDMEQQLVGKRDDHRRLVRR